MFDGKTVIVMRTLSMNQAGILREAMGRIWPGEAFTLIHGVQLTGLSMSSFTGETSPVIGPSERKVVEPKEPTKPPLDPIPDPEPSPEPRPEPPAPGPRPQPEPPGPGPRPQPEPDPILRDPDPPRYT